MSGPTKPYVIKQGDYLTRLAHRLGFGADEIWNLPENAELRETRESGDVLKPGDILYVPDRPKKRNPFTKESANRYVARVPKVPVELRLDIDGEPLAGEPYRVLELEDDEPRTTDGDGLASFEVDVHTSKVTIELPERDETLCMMIGHLDPAGEPSGARQRLTHLGYYGPRTEGEDQYVPTEEGQLAAALRGFQSDQGLEPTGELDEATVAALKEAHGS